MPRVTQREQYKRHLFLRTIWTDFGKHAYLTVLSPKEQRTLHAFYRPSEELTLKQFRDHLQVIHRDHPQLCHISGKLYRRIERAVAQHTQGLAERHAQMQTPTRRKIPARRGSAVVVYGIVRPKPDLNKLLKALIQMAREEHAEDEKPKH